MFGKFFKNTSGSHAVTLSFIYSFVILADAMIMPSLLNHFLTKLLLRLSQSINQSINQASNQSINQSINFLNSWRGIEVALSI